MSKKDTAKEAIAKRRDSQMEKMPIIKNGKGYPGKIGQEKPTPPVMLPIRAVAPPPPERAIKPEQKQEVIQALLDAWLKFPYLRLGQLVCLASDLSSPFYVEDGTLKATLLGFDHQKIRCDSLSHSRTMQCTMEYGHDDDRHFNHLVGMAWKRF
jgi:hypothetical protein